MKGKEMYIALAVGAVIVSLIVAGAITGMPTLDPVASGSGSVGPTNVGAPECTTLGAVCAVGSNNGICALDVAGKRCVLGSVAKGERAVTPPSGGGTTPPSGGTTPVCTDSDVDAAHPDGKNYGVKGTTVDATSSHEDGCVYVGDNLRLKEYYCSNGVAVDLTRKCGNVCESGACKASGTSSGGTTPSNGGTGSATKVCSSIVSPKSQSDCSAGTCSSGSCTYYRGTGKCACSR